MTTKTRQAEDVEPDEAAGEMADATADEEHEVVRWKPGRWAFEERTLRKSDLVAAGVAEEDAKDIVWDYGNKFSIPVDDLRFLSDEQFEALVERDPDLEVVTVED